jgi:DNA-binding LytR/AlgR family response regulator
MNLSELSTTRHAAEALAVALAQTQEDEPETVEQPSMPTRSKPGRIAIRVKRKILLIDPADLMAVEAKGNYVRLQLKSTSYELRESIGAMEKKLSPYGFVQIHRSVLVNSAWVEELESRPAAQYVLRVRGGKQYTVTRTYKENLQYLALSWIG